VSRDLRAVEDELASAIENRDVAAAGRLLADDFVLSSTGGVADHVSRDEWLGVLEQIDTRSPRPEVKNIRVFSDVAVVRLTVEWEATLGDRDLTGRYAVSDVFVESGEDSRLAWRISARISDD